MTTHTRFHALWSKLFPHRRALALIDARLDAKRGEPDLARDEVTWLDQHLAGCSECRAAVDARSAVLAALAAMSSSAPAGFTDRVLRAARQGSRVPRTVAVTSTQRPLSLTPRLAWAGAFAILIAAFAGSALMLREHGGISGPARGLETSGGVGRLRTMETPDFVVRAPGVGAAQVRSEVTSILERHSAEWTDQRDAVIAKIPRSALLGVTQDLARSGSFKMMQVGDEELGAERENIILRFELD